MAAEDAFYEPGEPGAYRPTRHTEGPWGQRFQHGGPPAALLARAIEQRLAGEELVVGRITYDILAPVPMRPVRVTSSVSRPGRRVCRVDATLADDGRPVVLASAWAVLPAPGDVPADTLAGQPATPPGDLRATDPTARPEWNCGFLAATEWRFVYGDYGSTGPAAAWVRPIVPLLAGEPLSPLQRLALTADSANGVSAVLDIRTWAFIPPELTLHVLRPPSGEWLCLEAASLVRPGTVGLAVATLHDQFGQVARSAQSLFVARQHDRR